MTPRRGHQSQRVVAFLLWLCVHSFMCRPSMDLDSERISKSAREPARIRMVHFCLSDVDHQRSNFGNLALCRCRWASSSRPIVVPVRHREREPPVLPIRNSLSRMVSFGHLSRRLAHDARTRRLFCTLTTTKTTADSYIRLIRVHKSMAAPRSGRRLSALITYAVTVHGRLREQISTHTHTHTDHLYECCCDRQCRSSLQLA
jgi:hypothetical protein